MKNSPNAVTESSARVRAIKAYAVHLYTASGLFFILLAIAELFPSPVDVPRTFLWLLIAVGIDATDGPLARRYHVAKYAGAIDGRKIDDIVDYLSFTLVPLLLVWRAGWLPFSADASLLLIAPILIFSVLGFANSDAKLDDEGFFLGFPSYWNIFALYAGIISFYWGSGPVLAVMYFLGVLTVAPVKFIYPNKAPLAWRSSLLWGAVLWAAILLAMLFWGYPAVPLWLLLISLVYPAYYTVLSFTLSRRS